MRGVLDVSGRESSILILKFHEWESKAVSATFSLSVDRDKFWILKYIQLEKLYALRYGHFMLV